MKFQTKSHWLSILTYIAMIVVAFQASSAHAVTYQASYDDSSWKTESGRLDCKLYHDITGYGHAIFGQKAGERQTLALNSSIGRLNQGDIAIYITSPAWSREDESEKLIQISAKMGLQPMKLEKRTVYQILNGLDHGKAVQIRFYPSNLSTQADAKTKDKIILSPIGFKTAYKDYLDCVDHLVPFTYKELKHGTFHFDSGSLALNDEESKLLQDMADYVTNDRHVYKIKLEGHSDSVGSFTDNRQLSLERAWHIKDLLVYSGVNPDLFEVRGFADRKPAAKNTTKEGRKKNRRVEITILR